MAKTKEQALATLATLLDEFHSSATLGVRDQRGMYPDTGHVHRLTTKRSLARDHIVDRLRQSLDGHADVRIDDSNQTTYFHLFGEYRMLVKKADEVGSVSLTGTQTSFDFQANAQLVLDPDVIPEVTNLYLSYVPNEIDPENPSVLLVCPTDGGFHWIHELEPRRGSGIVGEIGPAVPPDSGDGDQLVRVPPVKKTEHE
jgi:hypothetical protein